MNAERNEEDEPLIIDVMDYDETPYKGELIKISDVKHLVQKEDIIVIFIRKLESLSEEDVIPFIDQNMDLINAYQYTPNHIGMFRTLSINHPFAYTKLVSKYNQKSRTSTPNPNNTMIIPVLPTIPARAGGGKKHKKDLRSVVKHSRSKTSTKT